MCLHYWFLLMMVIYPIASSSHIFHQCVCVCVCAVLYHTFIWRYRLWPLAINWLVHSTDKCNMRPCPCSPLLQIRLIDFKNFSYLICIENIRMYIYIDKISPTCHLVWMKNIIENSFMHIFYVDKKKPFFFTECKLKVFNIFNLNCCQ